jgi:hypothetical protein
VPVDIDPGQDHDANLLAAFLENRLSSDERREMERHLADCRDCRETLALSSTASTASAPSERPAAFRVPTWLAAAAALALAGWFGYRTFTLERVERLPAPDSPRQAPLPAASPAARDAPAPPEALVPPPSSESSAPQVPPPGVEKPEPLSTKRGSERRIGSKTFRFVAGEWVDSAFDPTAGLPVVEARTAGERRDLVGRVPALAPFARMGGRVTVVVDGTVYLFLP